QFIKQLKKKFCLLLTATPVQNRLDEIFNLVSLLKPGHLGDLASFEEEFRQSKRTPKNEEKLKALMNKVMVRNRREETGIEWTKRIVQTIEITFSEAERNFYEAITSLKGDANHFSLLTLQREICSSKEAAFMTLKNMSDKANEQGFDTSLHQQLMGQLAQIETNSKAEKALELVQKIDDKVIIFTEYRATQLYLQWYLKQHGITSVPFRGGFKRGKKDWMRQLFEQNAQVLIATEAGGEGINLQFCSHIINYDLPWNPMRIEQRIGRVHRLGQKEDVRVYNFAIKDTVEEHILKLLYEKIALFESVVGELDDILSQLELSSLDEHLQEIILNSESEGEMKVKLDHLQAIIQDMQAEEEAKERAAK
ncbi:MAG TPA: DEAD/DEAH box helicase, partial [Bacilli bacterium]|nr:DEAD/DEAH box helicase [Bacilli bacterium]